MCISLRADLRETQSHRDHRMRTEKTRYRGSRGSHGMAERLPALFAAPRYARREVTRDDGDKLTACCFIRTSHHARSRGATMPSSLELRKTKRSRKLRTFHFGQSAETARFRSHRILWLPPSGGRAPRTTLRVRGTSNALGRCRMSDEKPVSETLETLAEKITALSTSTDARFAGVDKRFDEVSEAFVEQRRYTEFAFEQLRTEMNGGFGRLDRKLDRVLETLTRTLSPRRRRRS